MNNPIFNTNNSWVGFITRLTIGIVLFPHGAQKLLGIFGGYGFSSSMAFFTGTVHLPWIIALSIIIIEFFGSLSFIFGIASRIWAAITIILMLGIILNSHIYNGFFMNWLGTQKGEGYEYHLLVIGLCLATLVIGSGKYSVDKLVSKS